MSREKTKAVLNQSVADLSKAAANTIGMLGSGTSIVQIEVLGKVKALTK